MTETLSPQQLSEDGKRDYKALKYQEAASEFRSAMVGFTQAGDALSAAEEANNLSVTLLQIGDGEGALKVVESTETVFASAGDVRRQAMALGNKGSALEHLKRYQDAMAAYEQAAELFKQIGEHELRAPVLKSLSALQLKTGKQMEAMATMNAGLEEAGKTNPVQRFLKKLFEIPMKWFFHS